MRRAVEEHGRDPVRDDVWDWLAERTSWVPTEFSDDAGEDGSAPISSRSTSSADPGQPRYYLAVPPAAMPTLVAELGSGARRRAGRA